MLGDATVKVPLVELDVAIIGGVTFGTRCSLRRINLEIQPFTKKIFFVLKKIFFQAPLP